MSFQLFFCKGKSKLSALSAPSSLCLAKSFSIEASENTASTPLPDVTQCCSQKTCSRWCIKNQSNCVGSLAHQPSWNIRKNLAVMAMIHEICGCLRLVPQACSACVSKYREHLIGMVCALWPAYSKTMGFPFQHGRTASQFAQQTLCFE